MNMALSISCIAKARAHFWNFPLAWTKVQVTAWSLAEAMVHGSGCAQVISMHPLAPSLITSEKSLEIVFLGTKTGE